MGEQNSRRTKRLLQQQLGLRRRYLALLVPALAQVHAAHDPHGSGQQVARARAVRRAADTCLLQAMSTKSTTAQHQQIRAASARRRTCSSSSMISRRRLQRSSFSCKLLRKAKAKAKSSACRQRSTRAAAATANHHGQMWKGGLRGNHAWIEGGLSANQGRIRDGLRADDDDVEEEEEEESTRNWIPDESELKRLQKAIFPADAGDAGDDDDEAGDPSADHCGNMSTTLMSNPAALLSQAAQYIMALQVQVDALRSLANL